MKIPPGGDRPKPSKSGRDSGPVQPRRDVTQPPPQNDSNKARTSGDGKQRRQDLMERGQTPSELPALSYEQRQKAALKALEDNGFFDRPAVKEILDLPSNNLQRAQRLKEAISVELAIQELHLANPQQFEIYRNVVVSEKLPDVSNLQEWRAQNKGENAMHAYEHDGAVWRTVGEADVLILQKHSGSEATTHIIMEVKTGSNDKAARAQEQLKKIRVALGRFEEGKTDVGIHLRQGSSVQEDLTHHIARSGAAQFEGQAWGAQEKDGFPRRASLASRDFVHLTNDVLADYDQKRKVEGR